MRNAKRINRRFLKIALFESLAIACGLGGVAALRRATAATLTLGLMLLMGAALCVGAGIVGARGMAADLAETELVEEAEEEEDRRRPGAA